MKAKQFIAVTIVLDRFFTGAVRRGQGSCCSPLSEAVLFSQISPPAISEAISSKLEFLMASQNLFCSFLGAILLASKDVGTRD